MREHSPAWGGLDQVAKSGGQKIEANSFWYWAMQHGYKPPKVIEGYKIQIIQIILR